MRRHGANATQPQSPVTDIPILPKNFTPEKLMFAAGEDLLVVTINVSV